MKKVLLSLIAIFLILGVLGGAGLAGYRIGTMQGALPGEDGNIAPFAYGFKFGPQGMPMHNFQRGHYHGFHHLGGPGGFGMMGSGWGFGLFSPLYLLARLAVLGLILWLVYKLFKGNGWQLSLTRQTAENAKVDVTTTDK
ncbi:MAG TPA: hypothetical protein VJ022_14405 [Anaerolineales bacterium]|nr:hypothetical protein [Anaerolineales bacterium]